MITAEQMKDKLLTVDQLAERLEPTEGLKPLTVPMDGSEKVHFVLPAGWNTGLKDAPGTLMTDAVVSFGGHEQRMTKDAILDVTSAVGIRKEYVCKTPGPMIEEHLNYWMKHTANKAIRLLEGKEGVLATTKPTITPFSNIMLLEKALASIEKQYGAKREDVRVDYKLHHDLRRTSFRLIVPDHIRNISSARAGGSEDQWSTGIAFRNSIVGALPLSAQGYLFAWFCTNGAISTHASSGKYNRRTQGQGDEVYEWAQGAVDDILGGLEHELDSVSELAQTPIDGEAHVVLADIFSQYKVPLDAREQIISALAESDDLTMYGVMQAITQAANRTDLPDTAVTALMEIGGDLSRATAERCKSCHRLSVS